MKTVKCSGCKEQVHIDRSWVYWFGAQFECPGCGSWISPRDGKAQIAKRGTVTMSTTPSGDSTKPVSDFLSIIPGCFYAVAVLVGIGLGITTIAAIGSGNAEEVGYVMGYTVGGVLSILATGRLIELVQRISDDVRVIRERSDNQK